MANKKRQISAGSHYVGSWRGSLQSKEYVKPLSGEEFEEFVSVWEKLRP